MSVEEGSREGDGVGEAVGGSRKSGFVFAPFVKDINFSLLIKMGEYSEYHGTRLLLILIVIGSILSNSEWAMTSLCSNVSSVLIEAKILKIVCSMFLFSNFVWNIIDIIFVAIIGLTMESIKGTYSFLIFILFVSLTSQLMTLLIYLSMYYLTWNTFYLDSKICGLSPIIGAFAIALAQLSPNSVLIKNGQSFTISCKYFAFLTMVTCFVVGIIGISVTEMCLIECGLYSSWIFLRYFEMNKDRKEKGDDRDEFGLGMLFPPILRIPIVLMSNCCYSICDSVGCCHSNSNDKNSHNSSSNNNSNNNNNQNNNNNNNSSDKNEISENMQLYIDSKDDDDTPMDPDTQKKRDEAKKEIEKRLAELRKDMSDRQKQKRSDQN